MSSEERPSEPIGPPRSGAVGPDSEPGSYQQLRELFEEVTGTDKVTEKQESSAPSRYITDDQSGPTVAEYVGSMVRDDGLGETLAEPDTGSAPD